MENILHHDERFSASGKMKTENLCKMLMSSPSTPLSGMTDFIMFENRVMILLGPRIAYLWKKIPAFKVSST